MNSSQSSSLPWYRWLNSKYVIRLLETVQDFIVICLCIGLFSFMILQLREMALSLLPPLQLQPVTSDILSLLILVELFRLLMRVRLRLWLNSQGAENRVGQES